MAVISINLSTVTKDQLTDAARTAGAKNLSAWADHVLADAARRQGITAGMAAAIGEGSLDEDLLAAQLAARARRAAERGAA